MAPSNFVPTIGEGVETYASEYEKKRIIECT